MITTTDVTERKLRFVDLQEAGQENILARFSARNIGMWAPYTSRVRSSHADWDEKVLALHAAGHRYGLVRLQQLSWLELQGLLHQFDKAMLAIDAEAQRWVIEEAGKRYAHQVDMALLDAKIGTRELQLDERTQTMDAKIAALEADLYALETEKARLNITLERNELRVQEMAVQVELMDVEIASAEADLLREELKRLNAEIDVVKTEIRGIELQQAVTRVSLSLAQEEVRRAEVQVDIDRTEVQIEKEKLLEEEVEIEKLRLQNAQDETGDRATARETQYTHRVARHAVISAFLDKLKALYEQQADASEDEARSKASLALITAQGQLDRINAETRFSAEERTTRISISKTETDMQVDIARADDGVSDARITASRTQRTAAIEAARTIAEADIQSTLLHQITRGD